MRLNRKVAVVTGAASGIGAAIAALFAEQGAIVYATDINPVSGSRTIIPIKQDVSIESEWLALVERIANEQGKLSILINNAGIVGTYDSIDTVKMEDYHRVIAINQTGTFLGMRHCVPLMRKGGGGAVVNISSIWGLIGAIGVAPYQAAKGAVTVMTKNAALTYAPAIRVNSIHPGITMSGIIRNQEPEMTQSIVDATPLKRIADPKEIAYAALYLAGDESSYVTGAELVVDGGYVIR